MTGKNEVRSREGTSVVSIEGAEEAAQRYNVGVRRVEQIAQQSLNRMADSAGTAAARTVAAEVQQKYGYARRLIFVKKAFFDKGRLTAEITANRRGLLLSRYPYRQNKEAGRRAGIRIQVGRESAQKLMPGAFVIRLPGSGTDALAVPRDKGDRSHGRALVVLHGPSASQIFDTFRPRIAADTGQKLSAEIGRRLRVEFVRKS